MLLARARADEKASRTSSVWFWPSIFWAAPGPMDCCMAADRGTLRSTTLTASKSPSSFRNLENRLRERDRTSLDSQEIR